MTVYGPDASTAYAVAIPTLGAAVSCAVLGRPGAATGCAAAWLAGTAEFARARIAPGPRTRDEVVSMALTSVLIPPMATWHWLRGQVRHRRTLPWRPREAGPPPRAPREPVQEQVQP